jgi:hypothetical protein
MLRFIIWMIVVFIAAKIFGQVLRAIRLMLTPNRDVRNLRNGTPFGRKRNVEDIPYEEVKDKS